MARLQKLGLGFGAEEMEAGAAPTGGDAEKQHSLSPWRALPSDVMEQALALLPLPDLCRLRSVCRGWNELVHCAQFQERSLRAADAFGPFYAPRVGWKGHGTPSVPWSAYDLAAEKWRPMPALEFPPCARAAAWNLLAASGGLVCFGAAPGPRRILVCNPVTRAWRELPPPTLDYNARVVVIAHMVVDEPRASYKLLIAGTNVADLYDSVSKKWTPAEELPSGLSFRSGAYCDGEVYLLAKLLSSGLYTVRRLDLASLRWKPDAISMPPRFAKYPYVVACSGRVYLVGGSADAADTLAMSSIGLFELDLNGRWQSVSEYSNPTFLQSTGAIYGCGAHGGKIYVVTYAYDMWVAVFNCSSGSWEAPLKGNFFDMKHIFETKFAFHPNLRAAP